MAAGFHPEKVAHAFLQQYYPIVQQYSDQAYKFYNESSLVAWEGSDGLVTTVTTLSGIKEKIMSSDFRNCSVKIVNTDFQESLEGGVILVVNGLSTGNDNMQKAFIQTFFLAKKGKGFFVLNDILRFCNECELRTSSIVKDNSKKDQAAYSAPSSVVKEAISAPSAVATIVSDSHAVNSESASIMKKVKQGLDLSVVKNTDSKSSASKPSAPSHDKAPSVVKPVDKAPVVVKPVDKAPVVVKPVDKAPVVIKPVDKAPVFVKPVDKAPPVVKPVDKAPPVVIPVSAAKVDPKISYASMVAKVSPFPKQVKISSNAGNRVIPPSSNKASSTPGNVVPKSSVSVNDVPNTYSGVKTIYIGNLPHDITKQGVAEVIKKFGPVRRSPNSIQLIFYEDGFCYGFVEFESADAALQAVEAQSVQFGNKRAYISYKKSPSRGDDGYDNGEVGGNKLRSQSGNRTGYNDGQVRDRPRQNR